MTPEETAKDTRSSWANWWFLNGGNIHRAFKYRQWTQLKHIAETLPRAAWDVQQKTIDELKAKLEAAEAVCLGVENHLNSGESRCGSCKAQIFKWRELQSAKRKEHP